MKTPVEAQASANQCLTRYKFSNPAGCGAQELYVFHMEHPISGDGEGKQTRSLPRTARYGKLTDYVTKSRQRCVNLTRVVVIGRANGHSIHVLEHVFDRLKGVKAFGSRIPPPSTHDLGPGIRTKGCNPSFSSPTYAQYSPTNLHHRIHLNRR